MAESIKFTDKYIDTTGVYDSTLNKTQQVINSKIVTVDTSSSSIGTPNPVNADTLGGYTFSNLLANNFTTTTAGLYALDAAAGKTLNDSLTTAVTTYTTPIASYTGGTSYTFTDNWRVAFLTVISTISGTIYRCETTILRLDVADGTYYHYIGGYLTSSNCFGASVVIKPTSAQVVGVYHNGTSVASGGYSLVVRLYN